MDFELSDDQRALQDAARDLLESLSPVARVREVAGTGRHLDDELWRAMAHQGWLGIEQPEPDGGLGLGLVEVAVLCEELGRHLAPVPYLGTVLTLNALSTGVSRHGVSADAHVGDTEVGAWVKRLAAGEARGAVAWSARPGALRATQGPDTSPERRARPDGQAWLLTGRSDPVVYGAEADVLAAVAELPDGSPALFALSLPPDRRPRPEPAMDLTRSLAWLELRGEPALCLGGADGSEHLLDRAASALCAEMLGAATQALDMAVSYAKDRVQFGRPIGSFQAVKHRCADMLVDVEGMRSSAYFGAWSVGAGDPDASAAASAAKVWCSDAARRVMGSALQVHGGIGFTWEHDLHLFVKRAQLDQVTFGDAPFHRRRLVRILRHRVQAGLPVL